MRDLSIIDEVQSAVSQLLEHFQSLRVQTEQLLHPDFDPPKDCLRDMIREEQQPVDHAMRVKTLAILMGAIILSFTLNEAVIPMFTG